MKLIKNLQTADILMLALCILIILVSEYIFLTGDKQHGIFIGLWAPTLLGVMIYLKLVKNERR
jgi:hypothetical protein